MSVVVGIPNCTSLHDERIVYTTPARYGEALLHGSGALSVMIPPVGEMQLALLDRIDGLLVPGSASNVHPSRYGIDQSLTPELHDHGRDATTLPLIREAVARGMPVLAICRGIQELNVALGGTLHQNVHEKPGRHHHGGGIGRLCDADFGPRHAVSLCGHLAQMVGTTDVMVNSLHTQAIDLLAPGLRVEAVAEDGTVEAVSGDGTPGFVLGVQWHPEWQYVRFPASVAIFRAFGDACRTYCWCTGARRDRLRTTDGASKVVFLRGPSIQPTMSALRV
jgi:putative glutamine amidotransferase